MPELPEVEITARRIDEAVRGSVIESVRTPGINVLKTFDPPLQSIEGRAIEGVGRRGKQFTIGVEGDLVLLIHLMSAGRLQLYGKRASMKDRSSRLLIRLPEDRELRLREFGTKQAAWVKLLRAEDLESEEVIATLGPEAWPDPPEDFAALLRPGGARPLHGVLRDQRVIAGIGRSWVDEILWEVELSPFKGAEDLDSAEVARLRIACEEVLGRALAV